jgi:hypothetical protein
MTPDLNQRTPPSRSRTDAPSSSSGVFCANPTASGGVLVTPQVLKERPGSREKRRVLLVFSAIDVSAW